MASFHLCLLCIIGSHAEFIPCIGCVISIHGCLHFLQVIPNNIFQIGPFFVRYVISWRSRSLVPHTKSRSREISEDAALPCLHAQIERATEAVSRLSKSQCRNFPSGSTLRQFR